MARMKRTYFYPRNHEGWPPRPTDEDARYWEGEFMHKRAFFQELAMPLSEEDANELWRDMMSDDMDAHTWRDLLGYAEQAIITLKVAIGVLYDDDDYYDEQAEQASLRLEPRPVHA